MAGGFKRAVRNVMQGGNYSPDQAAAIVASASRNASPAAKAANKNLSKVPGAAKKKSSKKTAPSKAKKASSGKSRKK